MGNILEKVWNGQQLFNNYWCSSKKILGKSLKNFRNVETLGSLKAHFTWTPCLFDFCALCVYFTTDSSFISGICVSWCFASMFAKHWKSFNTVRHNIKTKSNRYNLTDYEEIDIDFRKEDFSVNSVFKNCDFGINQYYWKVATQNSEFFKYFYTHSSLQTFKNVFTAIKIKERKKMMINDFFEYCLVSHLANEDIEPLRKLGRGEVVDVSNVMIKTQNFFELEKNKLLKLQKRKIEGKMSTPDICLESGDKKIIIDAYNGTSKKEIKSKLRAYSECFPGAQVYVFASGIDRIEMFEVKSKTFALYCENEKGDLVTVEEILIGSLVINIKTINDQYFLEYSNFYHEVHYWLVRQEQENFNSI